MIVYLLNMLKVIYGQQVPRLRRVALKITYTAEIIRVQIYLITVKHIKASVHRMNERWRIYQIKRFCQEYRQLAGESIIYII